MTIDVITIFPRMVDAALSEGVIGRAREAGLVDVRARDLRKHTEDRHRTVDDEAYGGGPGMVMKPVRLSRRSRRLPRNAGRRRR